MDSLLLPELFTSFGQPSSMWDDNGDDWQQFLVDPNFSSALLPPGQQLLPTHSEYCSSDLSVLTSSSASSGSTAFADLSFSFDNLFPLDLISGASRTSQTTDQSASPTIGGEFSSDEALYLNSKQYHRILKRRAVRAKLVQAARLSNLKRNDKPYMHESRHLHAVKRQRGPGGRFLTADERMSLPKE